MCIVIIKKKNVDVPSDSIIKTCFENNPDGAGIMFLSNDRVEISKGFMSLTSLNNYLDKMAFSKNDTVVYHFRFATHGLTAKGQTHPFPISEVDKDLTATKATCDVAMAHNGILSAMQSDKILSDTMLYIKHIVSPIKNMIFDKAIRGLLDKSSVGSRLAFLDKTGKILTTGEWKKDKGLLYSNDGYKEQKWITTLYKDCEVDTNLNRIEYTDCIECPDCENISYSESENYCFECLYERFEKDNPYSDYDWID
jgi:predicted glutamine amidotransferase